jgi:hypothetical protein
MQYLDEKQVSKDLNLSFEHSKLVARHLEGCITVLCTYQNNLDSSS